MLGAGVDANAAVRQKEQYRHELEQQIREKENSRLVERDSARGGIGMLGAGVDANAAARQKEQYRHELEQQIREKENSRLVEREVRHGDSRFDSRPLPSAGSFLSDAITYEPSSRTQISDRVLPVCTLCSRAVDSFCVDLVGIVLAGRFTTTAGIVIG